MKKILTALVFVLAMMITLPIQAHQNFIPLTIDDDVWEGRPNSYRTGYVVNCREWISLREYPSNSAPRLAEIPLGAKVSVYNKFFRSGEPGIYNLFVWVTYNGMKGYALYHYIRLAD